MYKSIVLLILFIAVCISAPADDDPFASFFTPSSELTGPTNQTTSNFNSLINRFFNSNGSSDFSLFDSTDKNKFGIDLDSLGKPSNYTKKVSKNVTVSVSGLCKLPSQPTNGHYTANMSESILGLAFRSIDIRITCNTGYELTGSETRQCKNGDWSPNEISEDDCVQSTESKAENIAVPVGFCKLPSYPTNGRYDIIEISEAFPGQTFQSFELRVSCDNGYELTESAERVCKDGVWSPAEISDADCVITSPERAAEIVTVPSGSCKPSPYPANSNVSSIGFTGERLMPSLSLDLPSGPPDSDCVPSPTPLNSTTANVTLGEEYCRLPLHPSNGHYDIVDISAAFPGQTFQFIKLRVSCYVGYTLSGSAERLCNDGVWSPTEISDEDCVAVSSENKESFQSSTMPEEYCKLPPQPANGRYIVKNVTTIGTTRQRLSSIELTMSCNPGYELAGSTARLCVDAVWWPDEVSDEDCVPRPTPLMSPNSCRLKKDQSVHFRCLIPGLATYGAPFRECNEYEPHGTTVAPICNEPNYYYLGVLPYMRCDHGNWNYEARCIAECGRVVPRAVDLIAGGRVAEWGELPWHAAIYQKTTMPYRQICGGSIVSTRVVISAAHCFWDDALKALPAANYAVALGKLYRPWAFAGDQDVQRSDIAEIKMTPYFQGRAANFQDDIAILLLASEIVFKTHIRPVCVDFNLVFERQQLSPGNKGKIAGWGLTGADGAASQVLKVVEMPYISVPECQASAPQDFREHITADKFCAGYRNGTAVCQGDSGGGLAFPDLEARTTRYYLRGVVSTAPRSDRRCNTRSPSTYTLISRHEHFIKNYLL